MTHKHTDIESGRDRDKGRQTSERQTDRKIDKQTHRQIDRQTDKDRVRMALLP